TRKEFDAAYQLSLESLKMAREGNNPETLFYALNNIGSAVRVCGRFQDAFTYHLEALDMAHKFPAKRIWTAYASASLAEDEDSLGNRSIVPEYAKEAITVFRECGLETAAKEVEKFLVDHQYWG